MNKRRTFPFFFHWFREISVLRVFKVTKIKIYHIICYNVRLYFSIRKTIDNQQKENFLISSIYRTQKLIALRRFMLPGSLQKKEINLFPLFSIGTNSQHEQNAGTNWITMSTIYFSSFGQITNIRIQHKSVAFWMFYTVYWSVCHNKPFLLNKM